MKKKLLVAASLLLAASSFAQIIPNGSFEEWSAGELYEEPDAGNVQLTSSNFETAFRYEELSAYRGDGDSTIILENLLVTDGQQTDTASAYIVWGTPGDDVPFPGGFTLPSAPSSFEARVRFKANPLSPSFFIVQYVKADTAMLFETFYIEGDSSGAWVDFSWDLEVVPAIPDKIVVGIGVNDLVDDGVSYPDDFMEVDFIRFDGVENSIPGGEFNTWKMLTLPETPKDWWTRNGPVDTIVSKSIDATDGLYSLEVRTIEQREGGSGEIEDTLVGLLFLGDFDPDSEGITANVGVSTSGTFVLSYDYKYTSPGNDSGIVLFATGNATPGIPGEFDAVDLDQNIIYETSVWTNHVSEEISIAAGDSIIMAIASSYDAFDDEGGAVPGSKLWIDNMSLSIITGLNPTNSDESFTVFPNPSSGVFKYNFSGVENIQRVRVLDIAGTVIYEVDSFGEFDTSIDLSDQANGVYNLVIDTSYGTTSRKMVKQ